MNEYAAAHPQASPPPVQGEAWERCHVGSCKRHQGCMYTPCRAHSQTDTQEGEGAAALEAEARFLIDRLAEFEAGIEDGETFREYNGHVAPSAARLRAFLQEQEKQNG
ncbi:hypothetical protein [Novosphingobium sp. Chol11]|uniref:hypothetical protein n=1 Tax=Novosphingobium sp. Chol11 TaxID=1385763 RepID=UPI001C3EBE64|nr:hypothetical protein [Novosphingobium sp. Chol11]